ncbi:MAG: serine--tRNA ligase [Oligoflexales bacterium]
MLDIKYIRENLDRCVKGARDKNFKVDFQEVLTLDDQMRSLRMDLEKLQNQRNEASKAIAKADPATRETLKTQVAALKPDMERLKTELTAVEATFSDLMLRLPAPARADVPVGKDDTENVEVKKWGEPRKFDFPIKDHAELGSKLGIIDIERGVKLAGSRSYFLVGDGALLEQAVMRFVYEKLYKKGYTPYSIPVLVKDDAMTGTGYFPLGREQAYYVEKDELSLVGTSEVALTSIYSDEILNAEDLPIRVMAQSSCFRREAGTYGKDTQGLYRVHQFQKIEQVIVGIADEKDSEQLHAELLQNAEEILQALSLPYRVVYVCTGDLGQGQVRKHDIETWMPSRKNYGETHSCSTFHDFQARRLKMRYKDKSGEKRICHTLNNTAIASPRILIPLLENHQNADGTISIPECLQPYMGGRKKIGG